MADNFYIVCDEEGEPVSAVRKSQIDAITLGLYASTPGCNISVNGATVFIPNVDVKTVLSTIAEEKQ